MLLFHFMFVYMCVLVWHAWVEVDIGCLHYLFSTLFIFFFLIQALSLYLKLIDSDRFADLQAPNLLASISP